MKPRLQHRVAWQCHGGDDDVSPMALPATDSGLGAGDAFTNDLRAVTGRSGAGAGHRQRAGTAGASLRMGLFIVMSLLAAACQNRTDETLKAVAMYRAGRIDAARKQLRVLAERYPGDASIRLYLALSCRDSGDLGESARQFEACLGLDEKNGKAHSLYGDVLRRLGRLDEAVAEQKKAAELLPGDSVVWNNLALALARSGRFKEALEAYDKALAIDPASPVALYNQGELYRRMRQYPRAEESFERALSKAPDRPRILFSLAETEFELDKLDEARRHYNAIVAIAPAGMQKLLGRVFYQLGRLYLATGDPESAAGNFRLAMKHGYDEPRARLGLGKALYGRGDYARALETLAAIPGAAWTSLPELPYYLGLVRYELGRYDEALQALGQAVNGRLPKAPLFTRMGLCYLRLYRELDPVRKPSGGKSLLIKACGLFDRALKADPGHVPALVGRARAWFEQGKSADALRAARKVILLKPGCTQAHLLLGLCHYDLRQGREAAMALEHYLKLRPRSPRVRLFLGQILAELGRLREAETMLLQGLAARPDDWDGKLMLSWVYSNLGKYIAAADVLQDVLRRADDPKVLDEAKRMYELITRPFRSLLFPETTRDGEKDPLVPGSMEYIEAKLEPARLLLQALREHRASGDARKKLQSAIRKLIVDYNGLKRKGLFLDDGDRLYYRNEIRKMIAFFKQGSRGAGQ